MTTQEFMNFRAALMREIMDGNFQARTSGRGEWFNVDSTTTLSLYPGSSIEYRIKPKPREVWVSFDEDDHKPRLLTYEPMGTQYKKFREVIE